MDGFPIYGPNGCVDTDCAEIATFSSGWVQTGDPSTYAWDNYAFTEDDDELTLDQRNGRGAARRQLRLPRHAGFPMCWVAAWAPRASPRPGGGGGDSGVAAARACRTVMTSRRGRPAAAMTSVMAPRPSDNCPADCAGCSRSWPAGLRDSGGGGR
ncbi:MAG: hypothetical protein IPO67_25215 [Deltaproteobacteria bacterium]|nr:hypothetical protein [Deltaproteobacteria bacterium]